MNNQIHLETPQNGAKSFLNKNCSNDDHIINLNSIPIYSTRKSSRRLHQNLNLDQNFNNDLANNNLIQNQNYFNSSISNTNNLSNIKDNFSNNLNFDNVNSTSNNLTNQTTSTSNNLINSVPSCSNNNQTSNLISTVTKQQRKWEQWQVDDTRWFFEALNENGKDFNSIHNYMTNRLKKKGVSEDLIKNKEQIRCYFNRQWNKICSIFECNEDLVKNLDKTTKQLYALINYGEIWKKYNFKNDIKLDTKLKAHLNELVFKGYTFMKIGKKGKNVKLKTPICKALKKIYYFENTYKSVNQNLPKDIIIELTPSSNYAWMKVHSLAQNPRIKVRCSLQKRFSFLIKYLENRWNDKKFNNLQIDVLNNEGIVDCSKIKESSSSKNLNEKLFRIKPHPSHHKNLAGLKFTRIRPVQFNSQIDISLSAYLTKLDNKANQPNDHKNKRKNNLNINCSKAKMNKDETDQITKIEKLSQNSDKETNDNTELKNHSDKSNTTRVLQIVRELNLLNNIASSNYKETSNLSNGKNNANQEGNIMNCQKIEEKSLHLPDPPPNATIAEWLSANINNNSTKKQVEALDFVKEKNITEINIEKNNLDTNDQTKGSIKASDPKELIVKKSEFKEEENIYNKMLKIIDPSIVKVGWTAEETEDLTIGELYLMLKKPLKIILQYDWCLPEKSTVIKELGSPQKNLNKNESCSGFTTNYSSLISKLITAVNLEIIEINKEKESKNETESETSNNKNTKNTSRKNKKLKTLHGHEDNNFETNNDNNLISSSSEQISSTQALNINTMPNRGVNLASTSQTDCDNSPNSCNNLVENNQEKFVVPVSPVPKNSNKQHNNKARIINEALLQEAKEQLCNIKFNSRRNFRKPAMMKQQYQLNLNKNQILEDNIRQLFANQGAKALTTVPVNVSNSSNGQTALISVITQVNQNSTTNNNSVKTINIESTNTIQFNNSTTVNDLCNYVTNCPDTKEKNIFLNETLVDNSIKKSDSTTTEIIPLIGEKNEEVKEKNIFKNSSDIQDTIEISINNILNENNKTTNNKISSNFNENCLKSLNDVEKDQSVGFGNLLDISLGDNYTIFNDSLPFPSEVSIDSNFSKDETLNTPIKMPSQSKNLINHQTNFINSQFNLFDSNSMENKAANISSSNVPFSNSSFSDGWINNLNSDISLSNIFDCTNEHSTFKNFPSTSSSFNDKKEELFNDFDSVLNTERLQNNSIDSSIDLLNTLNDFNNKNTK